MEDSSAPMKRATLAFLLTSALAAGCAGFTPLYPARPPATPGEAIADPTPSRVVLHATITSSGLKAAIEDSFPKTGEGTFPLLGTERRFTWRRNPAGLRFDRGRIALDLHVD